MSDDFFNGSLPCFSRQGLSLNLELAASAILASQDVLGTLLSVSGVETIGIHCHAQLSDMGSGTLNSDLHAWQQVCHF